MNIRIGILAALFLGSPAALAQATPAPGTPESSPDPAAKLWSELKPQTGNIALPGGFAELKLGDSLKYLTPADSKRLLEEGWGNPPSPADSTLGMIVPAEGTPLAADGWGVVITYNNDGHVSDEDANKIDYAELLKDMQQATLDGNEARTKAGYAPLTLYGWAEPPHYDAATHKMYWAKDLQFGDSEAHTLNYFVRVLGRQGVLELNAVASMRQLPMIRAAMKDIEAVSSFTAGNGYEKFDASTDKLAAYGLAALVAGGVAAKTGLLAKLFAVILALKKFILIGIAAIAGLFGKLFGKKKASAYGPGSSGGPST